MNRRGLLTGALAAFTVSNARAQFLSGGRSSLGNSVQVQEFFDRLASPLPQTLTDVYAAFADALSEAEVLPRLAFLHIGAGPDESVALTNVNSASYFGCKGGPGLVFTAGHGWNGGGSSVINTQFNPALAGGKYARDDACLFAWSLTSAASGGPIISVLNGNNSNRINGRHTTEAAFFNVNQKAHPGSVANTDGSGLFIANRTSPTLTSLYRNDALLGTDAALSEPLESQEITYGTSDNICAIVGAGLSLNAGQRTALYVAGAALLTGLGL